MFKKIPIGFALTILLFTTCYQTAKAIPLVSQTLTAGGYIMDLMVPKGFRVEFLFPLDTPRLITLGPDNELLIGSKSSTIYRVPYPYTTFESLVDLSASSNSVAYRDGNLYSAQTAGLYSAPYFGTTTSLSASDFSLITSFPATGGHSSRTVVAGPDQQLYIGIGISGNCPDEYADNSYPFERRRGGVFQLDESTVSPELLPYSSGLRNPVGLAFHPDSEILYATNAGPDNMGFEEPPEIFAALEYGSFHGMPWFQYIDTEFTSGDCATSPSPRPIVEAKLPAALFDARSTPLGVAFVTTDALGSQFSGNAIIAIHGSWAKPPGGDDASRRAPKLSMVTFKNQRAYSVEDVITGFQRSDGSRFGRPAGVAVGGDGNLYFTSDGGDVTGLFRLVPTHQPPRSSSPLTSTYILLL